MQKRLHLHLQHGLPGEPCEWQPHGPQQVYFPSNVPKHIVYFWNH